MDGRLVVQVAEKADYGCDFELVRMDFPEWKDAKEQATIRKHAENK